MKVFKCWKEFVVELEYYLRNYQTGKAKKYIPVCQLDVSHFRKASGADQTVWLQVRQTSEWLLALRRRCQGQGKLSDLREDQRVRILGEAQCHGWTWTSEEYHSARTTYATHG